MTPTTTSPGQRPFADLPGDIEVSFEVFPPKNDKGDEQLWATLRTLEPLAPSFVSVTYGAGGSTRDNTLATVSRIARETSVPAAAHLTCVDASRTEIDAVARDFWEAGVRHIVALRGDSPRPGETFTRRPDGYADAAALVAGLREVAPFEISVAAYPEGHPKSPDLAADIDNLKRKIDAGAHRAITQFFFAPETFLRFRDRAVAAGVSVDIMPGIMPVTNLAGTTRMAASCGTDVPASLARLFEGLDEHPAERQLVAATVAAEMCRTLYAEGVRSFHFYTLNRAELSHAVCRLLGVRAAPLALSAAA